MKSMLYKEKKQLGRDAVANKDNNINKVNNVNSVNDVNIVYFITTLIAILGFNAILCIISAVAYGIGILGVDSEVIINKGIDILSNKMIAMLLSQILIVLPLCVFLYNRKKYVQKILGFNKINIVTLFALALFTYAMIPVMSFVNILSMMFVKNQISDTIYEIVEKWPLVLGIIVVAVLPAFVEELLFRGALYNAHRKIDIKMACLINGFLFGLLHGNFNQFAYAFIMGCVFAVVVEITDSVISTIWCHFIINANSLLMAYVGDVIKSDASIVEKTSYTWKEVIYWGCFSMVALCFAILILIFIAKYNKRYEYIKDKMFKNAKGTRNQTLENNKKSNIEIEEKNIRSSKIKGIMTLSLIFAIILNIVYMICIEICS